MAAGRASLLPQDDLTLACVLKSPLIGLDDDDLIALAPGRDAQAFSMRCKPPRIQNMRAPRTSSRFGGRGPAAVLLLFTRLFSGADGGRRDMEARARPGSRRRDRRILNLAMAHEGSAAPSLAAFLNDLAGIEYSIKRDMETGEDAVRVMTVHAAKGLEAKIMFLPDTCGVPSPRHDPKIFTLSTNVPGEETIAWSPRKEL